MKPAYTMRYWASALHNSDCNPEAEFSIPGFGIEKFVILGSRFGIRLLDWSSFWYLQLTYFTHKMLCGTLRKVCPNRTE